MLIRNEKPNNAAITTKFIMNRTKDITYVFYDEEGDWQFFSGDDVNEDDVLVVSIGQIIERDPSVLKLPSIKKDSACMRENVNSKWQKLKD